MMDFLKPKKSTLFRRDRFLPRRRWVQCAECRVDNDNFGESAGG